MKVPGKVVLAVFFGVVVGLLGSSFVPKIVAAVARRGSTKERSPIEWQKHYLEVFRREGRNPSWADSAAADVAHWFDLAHKDGALVHLNRVECRTHSCVAELQWKNRDDAEAEFRRFIGLSAPSLSGCTSQLLLDPTNVSPYRASLILVQCL